MSIHPIDDFGKEWLKEEKVLKTLVQKEDKAIYFIAICSNSKPTKLGQINVIAEAWSDKNVYKQDLQRHNMLLQLKKDIKEKNEKVKILNTRLEQLETQYSIVTSSLLWKITKPLRRARRALKNKK